MYKIILDGDHGTTIARAGTIVAQAEGDRRLLTGAGWRGFWVTILDGSVSVGRRGEAHATMTWTDPDPLAVQFFGFYTGPGSGGGSWRFYLPHGAPQPSVPATVVFSFQVSCTPVVNEAFTITIKGVNLPASGDRLKVISSTATVAEPPTAGSRAVHNLKGSASLKAATVTFTEVTKWTLAVAYDAGIGEYELVRPDLTNQHTLVVGRPPFSVYETSERLLKPIVPRALPWTPQPKPKAPPVDQEKLLERLYTRAMGKEAPALPPPPPSKKLTAEEQAKFTQKIFYQDVARAVAASQHLHQKYPAMTIPSRKVTAAQMADLNTHFFYRHKWEPPEKDRARTSPNTRPLPALPTLPTSAPARLEGL